ncbi:hypothetical protein VW23_007565 [Devosia insulae DS-56]|uniref:Luciferase-like domain-containing protein n=2 Tax=Devosia insulae TaxID=408174 RepID=A0A1E5XXD9_9HYPH|nr:hypothetical protein VW23_007565 [Devosia insulae DS-56]
MTTPKPTPEFRAGAALFLTGRFVGASDQVRFASAVETALAAEAEGFDDLWATEHHYLREQSPSALTLAAYLLGRTTRVRVGTAVTMLPVHSPVHVAEQAALLDQLSGGRFDLGLGRGAETVEYEVMSSLTHYNHGMAEALDLLLASFAGSVAADTELYRFRRVSPQPRPLTSPHPPILMATESDSSLALAARHGFNCMFFFNHGRDAEALAELSGRHAAIAAEHGHPGPWHHTVLVYAQVADTDAEAAEIIRGPLLQGMTTTGAEYIFLQETVRQNPDRGPRIEHIVAQHAVGTPQTCAERLVGIVETSGIGRVILAVEAAGTPDGALDNVRRLGREVLPLVRDRLA